MSMSVLFLALATAIAAWWFVARQLRAKPWMVEGEEGSTGDPGAVPWPAEKVGLWAFLGVVASLFALFISAYFIRRHLADWSPLPEPTLLWFNTFMLVMSSIALQKARGAARREQPDAVKIALIAGGIFTFAFIAGQLWAWQQLTGLGYFLTSNPANSFFYVITALHGLHLLGGLWVWGKTTGKALLGVEVGELRLSVELCTIYWHFLLLVWLVLFWVLLST